MLTTWIEWNMYCMFQQIIGLLLFDIFKFIYNIQLHYDSKKISIKPTVCDYRSDILLPANYNKFSINIQSAKQIHFILQTFLAKAIQFVLFKINILWHLHLVTNMMVTAPQ